MGRESFTDRFRRLVDGMTDLELATAMGMRSVGTARDLKSGATKMLKLDQALRLADYLAQKGVQVDLWDLAAVPRTGPRAVAAPTPPSSDRLERVEAGLDRLRDDFQQALAQAVAEREQMLAIVKNAASKPRPHKERAG